MKGKRLQNLPQEETDRPLEVMDIAPHRQRLTEEVAATTSSGQAEEVKALTAALQGEMRRHRRDRKLYVAGTLSFLCLSLALLIAIGNIGAPHPLSTAANACFLAFVTLRIIYMVPVLYTQWKPRRCRRNLTAQLA